MWNWPCVYSLDNIALCSFISNSSHLDMNNMKKTFYTALLLILIASGGTLIGCSGSGTVSKGGKSNYTYSPGDTQVFDSRRVSVDSARSSIDTLQQYLWAMVNTADSASAAHGNPVGSQADSVIAFKVHASDLFAALGVQSEVQYDHDAVRVYIGFDKTTSSYKLFVVPVDKTDTGFVDMFFDETGKVRAYNPNDANYVMDLNTPCPPTCDCNSPLMQGLINQ